MERKNSFGTAEEPHPIAGGFLRPGFPDVRIYTFEFWPGGRRIQDPQGKEVRLAVPRFLTSRPPVAVRKNAAIRHHISRTGVASCLSPH